MPVGNVGRHPFSNRRTKIEGWTFTSCVSSLCHFSTYNLHTSVKKGFIFMKRAHFNIGFGKRIAIRSANPDSLNMVGKVTLDEKPQMIRSTIPSGYPSDVHYA